MQAYHNNPASALSGFIRGFEALLAGRPDPDRLREQGSALLGGLVRRDDWLAPADAAPGADSYRQNLLHLDPDGRFCVVAFVWGPGQETPIHDHTVWGLIGMLRGEEIAQPFAPGADGRLQPQGQAQRLRPGQIEAVSPTLGDVHQVSNASADQTAISIHVYGANIGAVQRWVYAEDGSRKPFISGYSNPWVPNLWDRSKENR